MATQTDHSQRVAIARWTGFGLTILVTIGVFMLNRGGFKKPDPVEIDGYKAWAPEVVEAAKKIPVQNGGRIKPFETRARFMMMEYNGSKTITIRDGEGKKIKIGPTEWLLDLLFRPDLASKIPTFRVDNTDVLKDAGLAVEKRRDRYSYEELDAIVSKLGRNAGDLAKKIAQEQAKDPNYKYPKSEPDPRTLATQVRAYQAMLGSLEFARTGVVSVDTEKLEGLAEPENMKKVSFWIKSIPLLASILHGQSIDPESGIPEHVNNLLGEVEYLMNRGTFGIEWVPPYEANIQLPKDATQSIYAGDSPKTYKVVCVKGEVEVYDGRSKLETLKTGQSGEHPGADLNIKSTVDGTEVKVTGNEWHSFGDRFVDLAERGVDRSHWGTLAEDAEKLEKLVLAQKEGGEAFAKALGVWGDHLAERSGDVDSKSLGSELRYFKNGYFGIALVLFLLAFVFMAISWLSPETKFGRILHILTWVLGGTALIWVIVGVVHRSILMGRPPVGNLYDTIPFITGSGLLVLFLLEAKTRRRLALGAGITIGVLGMFLTGMYEGVDAKDHLNPLRAVLRSNFWLATHVVIITLGYSGGLIAAAMSHIYIYARIFGLDKADRSLRRFLTRSVYGLICFTLLFSLVGTVLGGIWANDSWGRFWGWDPKENGALLIVLWCLMILHARLAGFLREWGIHVMSVLGAVVVAFSWWGVNLLETGLHSYGFTDGVGVAVNTFYAFEGVIALVAFAMALNEFLSKRSQAGSASEAPPEDDGPPPDDGETPPPMPGTA